MRAFRRGIIRNERIGWRRAGGSASLLKSIQSDQKEACTLSLQRLPRHPFHGALKWKPSGIPSAAIIRSQCFSQFQLSSFRRRVGTPPLRCKSLDAACFLESMEMGPVAHRPVPFLGQVAVRSCSAPKKRIGFAAIQNLFCPSQLISLLNS